MSIAVATSLPVMSQSPMDPPNIALPPLPSSKPRKSLPHASSTPADFSADQSPTKLRSPSTPLRPSALPTPQHAISHPVVPTLRSISSLGKSSGSIPERTLRKTISIAAFPQPPKPSTTPSPVSSIVSSRKRSVDRGSIVTNGSNQSRRQSRMSTATTFSTTRYSQTPSLLNGGGDGRSIPVSSSHRVSDGSNPSPAHSRSSSAQGSCSTTATTFEDTDDMPRRGREGADEAQTHESTSRGKEAKGNVIVSVRVRPDTGSQESLKAEGEWMVDGRRALVAYRGREGGDYHYGKPKPSNLRTLTLEVADQTRQRFCHP
jgi:centromeric protein E